MALNRLRVIGRNLAREATLSALPAPSLVAAMPVTNLQNSNRSRSFRSTAIDEDGFSISFELAQTAKISAVVLYGHNLRATDQWRVRLWSGPGKTGTVTDIGWNDALQAKTAGELEWGVEVLGATVFDNWPGPTYSVVWFGAVPARSGEIEIISDGNEDGYVDINELIFGPAMSPDRNFNYGYSLDYFDTSTYTYSQGNSVKTEKGVYGRRISLTLGRVSDDERAAWSTFMLQTLQYGQLFISLFPEAGGVKERDYSMVCIADQRGALVATNATRLTQTYTFQEA